jgi:hypothetical protein
LGNRQMADGSWTTVAFANAQYPFTGGAYQVVDATATTPGTYQYQLVAEQMNGTVQTLATASVVAGSPVVVTLQVAGGYACLNWTGGAAPYQVQMCTSLTPAPGANATVAWVNVPLSNPATNAVVVPVTNPAAFFRVQSLGF